MSKLENVIAEVVAELRRAARVHPRWSTDPIVAAAVVSEEAGELTQAVLHAAYEPSRGGMAEAHIEAVQTAASAIRYLLGEADYQIVRSPQVPQVIEDDAQISGGACGRAGCKGIITWRPAPAPKSSIVDGVIECLACGWQSDGKPGAPSEVEVAEAPTADAQRAIEELRAEVEEYARVWMLGIRAQAKLMGQAHRYRRALDACQRRIAEVMAQRDEAIAARKRDRDAQLARIEELRQLYAEEEKANHIERCREIGQMITGGLYVIGEGDAPRDWQARVHAAAAAPDACPLCEQVGADWEAFRAGFISAWRETGEGHNGEFVRSFEGEPSDEWLEKRAAEAWAERALPGKEESRG